MKAKINENNEEFYYRVYVTDSLKGIFKMNGGEVRLRYFDIVMGSNEEVDERTAEEIIEDIRMKLEYISEV